MRRGDFMDINHYNIWIQIGLNILYHRKEQRLTQAQLSEMVGITPQYMQRVETANASCSMDTLIDIANALNIPLYKLFQFKE